MLVLGLTSPSGGSTTYLCFSRDSETVSSPRSLRPLLAPCRLECQKRLGCASNCTSILPTIDRRGKQLWSLN